VTAPQSAQAQAPAMERTRVPLKARVAVLGPGGYTGGEFARLALGHPGLTLDALVVRDPGLLEGQHIEAVLPGLDPRAFGPGLPAIVSIDGLLERVARGAVDTLIVALPHGVFRELLATRPDFPAHDPALRIVDLSSDHRDGGDGYVYGLPEAFRDEIKAAHRVANPGCYPTAFALALLPAARAGLIAGPVVVSALSGVSGAGRVARLGTSFVEIEGGASFYKVGTVHQHVAEMERTLARLALGVAAAQPVAFAPQLVPVQRGILLTANAPLALPVAPAEARALYEARYKDEPFVRLLPEGQWPETRAVRGSNRVDVQVTTLFEGRTLLALAAIDNLAKGAASQALQNLNLVLGWPETTGLARHGQPW